MDQLTRGIPSLGKIDLACETDFMLGPARVRPSRCEVESGDRARQGLQRRVMQVLVALARSPNDVVSQPELISRCWGGLSVSEDAIGRCIGQLRKLAAAWDDPPFAIETIPGVGYRINPRALEVGPGVAAHPRRRFPWPWAAAAALALAGVGSWWFFGPAARGSQAVPYPTLKVTPFQSADASAAAKAYAAVLTAEVSDAASRYNLVVVKPGFVKAGLQLIDAGADFLVEGRVIKRGAGRIVTSDLVDAHHGVVVYSFDTPAPANPKAGAANVIAGHIARSLDPSKLTNDLGGKLSASDYTLVARANDAIERWDMQDTLGQVRTLAQRHPDDVDLKASSAITAVFAAQQAQLADRPALIRLARAEVAQADRLGRPSALLHIVRQMLLVGPLTWAAQETELRRALEMDPNLHVSFNGLGELMLSVGRTKEAVGLLTRSIQLDPMSEVVVGSGLRDFVLAGAADEAEDARRRLEDLWPDQVRGHRYARYMIAFYLGSPKQALAVLNESPEPIHQSVSPRLREALLATLRSGDPAALRRMVAECFANYGRSAEQVGDEECLVEMVARGDLDDAFRFAELAYPDHRHLYPPGADGWLVNPPLGLDPAWMFTAKMKPFRDDSRFWDVALRTGLVDYWLGTNAWPDMCQDQLALCRSRAMAAVARDRSASPGPQGPANGPAIRGSRWTS